MEYEIDHVKKLRTTGRGSDFYGVCEICKKNASEVFVMEKRRIFRTNQNKIQTSPIGGGMYGHKDCLISRFGNPNIINI